MQGSMFLKIDLMHLVILCMAQSHACAAKIADAQLVGALVFHDALLCGSCLQADLHCNILRVGLVDTKGVAQSQRH